MDAEKFKHVYNTIQEQGFAVCEDFYSPEEVSMMRNECCKLLDQVNPEELKTVFTTGENQVSNEYFIKSANKIRYFLEKSALNEKGELQVEKRYSVNKIGHALHSLNPIFKNLTFSTKIKDLARALRFKEPAVCQSMCIFKQPFIGDDVVPHQDSTYLYTDPLTTVGFWIALDDVTLSNGCLWFVPGSHKGEIAQRYVRCENATQKQTFKLIGDKPEYEDNLFVPVPVKKGSLVLIHGSVVHKSQSNPSSQSRYVYTFHLVETKDTTYSSLNWLQPTEEWSFPLLNDFTC